MGRLIFRAFQCEMELDYITVSRLLLVPVVNACESIKNWFQLIHQNLSWLQYCVLLTCVWLRNILRKWFVTTVLTLPTHVLQPHGILYGFSVLIQKQFLAYFSSFPRRSKISIRKALERIRKSYSFSENYLKHAITLANNMLRKASKLPISLEQFLSIIATWKAAFGCYW